jgi:hypothetical protein
MRTVREIAGTRASISSSRLKRSSLRQVIAFAPRVVEMTVALAKIAK